MSDSGSNETQSALSQFSGGEAERDAAAEARAVAGGQRQDADAVVSDADWLPEVDGEVEMAVVQVDYTVEGYGSDEHPVVHVFGRTPDDELEHVRVFGFRPYFYAPTASLEDGDLDVDSITGHAEADENGEPYESIRGEKLTKIYGRTPRDVGNIRDRFDHYEADILFPNRFLIDKDIKSGIRIPERRDEDGDLFFHDAADDLETIDLQGSPRVNYFDIEVDDRSGFPEDGEEPIICLTSFDNYDEEYIAWLYEAPEGEGEIPESLPGYDPIEEIDLDVRTFEREEAMLAAFLDYLDETDPDILTGWNFDDFDAPYFIDRLDVLSGPHEYDLDSDRLSRVNEVWDSDWGGPTVKGRVVFDLLYAYKRTQRSELESYRLDAVGEVELGVGKERYAGDIGDLWENDPERLLEYNVRDVELCAQLDKKQDIVSFWQEVASFVGCKLEDATTPGDAVDVYVLHKAYGRFALPSKGKQESEDFEGGAVFEPITGVKENVTVLDLKSLYPMSMTTINASPETKVDPDEFDGETYRAPTGTHFRKKPDGIIREIIDETLDERDDKKELRDEHSPEETEYERFNRQQAAVKVIMNCFTPDTEVLTPDGVRAITDLEVGDEVYSLNPDTEQMEVKPVTETHAYPDYEDELVDIETSQMDFRVTPNHRMLVRKNETNGITEDGYSFVEAGDLDRATNYELPHGWTAEHGDDLEEVDLTRYLDGEYEVWVRPSVHGHTFAAELGYYPDTVLKNDDGVEGYIFDAEEFEEHREYIEEVCEQSYVHSESGRKWIPRTYDGDDFVQLLAWYITEGNVYTSEDKQFGENFRGSATTVKIAQDAPIGNAEDGTEVAADGGDHAGIGNLLARIGFNCYSDDQCHQFTSKLFGNFLRETCGEGSFEKHIPDLVWGLSERQKRLFLDTLVAGDGDRQVESWRYTTSSDQLRDDVMGLCAHLGLNPKYNRDSGSWRIYVDESAVNTLRMHRSSSRSTANDGVYCVTVEDNHTLLAGRNGKFQFVGQSLYGVSGWDRFRLYDKEAAAAITATGRDVIEYTDETATDLGYSVAYGDTDSVMLELGHDVEKQDALDQSFEIESQINDAYDDFALEELNAEHHRFQIEFEKLYRRFFQAGTKKRYAGHIIWKEGKDVDDIDITGFEYKRSDIAPITKEVQREVIEMIVHGEDLDNVKDYVHDVIQDFQGGNVDYDDVGIPGGIGKRLDAYDTATAQVRGAQYANLLLGTNFQRGSKPKRLYLEGVHPDFWQRIESEKGFDPSGTSKQDRRYREFKKDHDVICFEYSDQIPEEFEVDWDKMLDKTLEGPIERVLEALDISWDEVKTGQEQTGLGSFV